MTTPRRTRASKFCLASLFGGEILDGLKVDERVSATIVPLIVGLDDGLAEFLAPQRQQNGPYDVDPNEVEDGDGQGNVLEVGGTNNANDQALRQGRNQPQE
jgi:hypothetical protein